MMLALVLALSLTGHARSEGRSSFIVDDAGRVNIEIEIGFADVPELCNADLLVEDARKPEMRERLSSCLVKDTPNMLRVRGDDKVCPVVFDRFEEKPGTLHIFARADCGELPRVVVIDWGLFAGAPLDHVSVARIEQPYAAPKLAMLSKRSAKLIVDIDRPRWPLYAAGAAAVVVAALLAWLIARARRRG